MTHWWMARPATKELFLRYLKKARSYEENRAMVFSTNVS